MKDFNLRLYLKTNLRKRENLDYLNWLADTNPHKVGHHIIGKRNDLLIAKVSDLEHKKIHSATKDALSFEEQLVLALENIFDYVEYLQRRGVNDELSELI